MVKLLLLILLAGGLFLGYDTYKEHLPAKSRENLEKVSEGKLNDLNLPKKFDKAATFYSLEDIIRAKMAEPAWVKLEKIPLVLQQAIISVEDSRFYQHGAFDASGIVRAFLVNLQSGEIVEGGSTITQQLAKNLFLEQEQTYARKAEEALYSILIERNFTKEEILEIYLNTIYFGSGAYGIKAASEIYFNKQPSELTIAESSMLAGIPAAPSVYSPLENPAMAKRRQAIVLETMVKNGFLGPNKAQEILAESPY